MGKRLVDRLSYANVVSTLCLFLTLGIGGAYAADKLAKNSVGSKQIKAGAVKSAELADGSVTTRKVAPGAVTPGQLADGAVTTPTIATGAVGSPQIADVSVRAEDLAPPEPWHEIGPASGSQDLCTDPANTGVFCSPNPLPGWSNLGSGFSSGAFYKDQLGIVHLRGTVSNGSIYSDKAIFRLPAGYRPENRRLFTFNGRVQDQEVLAGRVDVLPDGRVVYINDCGTILCSASSEFVSLDGMSFRPDE